MHDNKESRSIDCGEMAIELRGEGDAAAPVITGYAAVYDQLSDTIGGMFRERIEPGAFAAPLQRGYDVRALVDHNPEKILGRVKSGTLRLSQNPKGLRCEIDPPDTQYARDLMSSIKRGDISQMSFSFRTIEDSWDEKPIDGKMTIIRTLHDMELCDVSPVTYPAYPQTEVGVRRLQEFVSRNKGLASIDLCRRYFELLSRV